MAVSGIVLIVIIAVVLFFMSKKGEGSVAWGQVVTGGIVALLLISTPVGPHLQDGVKWLVSGVDSTVSDAVASL
ncbi:hypothetical protein EV191_1444 [Tamaricihabitans halophyticus]|uniref:Uncharacterized protein n=1 Tax=Tamaricihabitans halophyticus TaxID=1262583 RepID=A0A4R2PU49_9PSEU|nr:hypothetical protein [Tamaricihabitans halophyticus]TCP38694.1 hypothetical protein EV191_1444 [Tamaricihabitans halophyticus]